MKWIMQFIKKDFSNKTIEQLWSVILQKIDKKAWGLSKRLNLPASIVKIESIEKEMELELPEQLKQLYMCNNGEGNILVGTFYGLGFMSLEEMYSEWCFTKSSLETFDENMLTDFATYCSSTPIGAVKKMVMNSKWIPIAKDWGGNFLAIDLDPDINGQVGQIINIGRDEDDKFVIANSLKEYLILLISHLDKYKFYISKSEECAHLIPKGTAHALDFYNDIFKKKKADF